MKATLACALMLSMALSVKAITIDMVTVGNPGNAPDTEIMDDGTTGYGSVGYNYQIGKYEVTVGQYAAFLNAVASTDTYLLYSTFMASERNIAGISRSGSSGSYTYSVIGSANHPVTYVSWGDAARFANWLHNGQPTGAEGPGTTETGAYTLNGATSQAGLMAVTRNLGAQWFIPTENEWYKADYYQPAASGGDSDGYWSYPMKTNSVPYSDQPPGATPDGSRVGNFYRDDGLANGYNDGYAVTGSTLYSSSQNYLTDVGAYSSSPSFYGTFDQGGNVWEWNETAVTGSSRGVRGGSYSYGDNVLQASHRGSFSDPALGGLLFGFRVASAIPEPSTLLLAIAAFATLLTVRRR